MNQITIKQSKTIPITTLNILGVDTKLSLTYKLVSVQNGRFEISSNPGNAITSFTHTQLLANQVQFVQDGSINPPSYFVVVNDGSEDSPSSTPTINFIPLPLITKNELTIKQSKTVLITPSIINGSGGTGLTLTFTVSNNLNINFIRVSTGSTISSFTLTDITNADVKLVHDGSTSPPSYNLKLSDGSDSTSLSSAAITFIYLPTLTQAAINIKQGKTIILDNTMIIASISSGFTLTLVVSVVSHGKFCVDGTPGITSFTFDQLLSGSVNFVHDNSLISPSFDIQANDGSDYTNTLHADVIFTLMPAFVINKLTIEQGTSVLVTKALIDASIPSFSNVIFTIESANFCSFSSNTATNLTQFSQNQILSNSIQFVHDGSNSAPSYTLSINDGFDIVSNASDITFIKMPTFLAKQITIRQGQRLIITTESLQATSFNGKPLIYIIGNIRHGQFELATNPNVYISSFNQAQLDAQIVVFVHDNSAYAPSIQISLLDGRVTTTSTSIDVTFLADIDLVNNNLRVSNAQTVLITQNFLKAVSYLSYIDSNNLIFIITKMQHGKFIHKSNVKNEITSFLQKQIINGEIGFIHDGNNSAPSFFVSVGLGSLFTTPMSANISYENTIIPTITVNLLFINQGQGVTLSTKELDVNAPSSSDSFIFSVIDVKNGKFHSQSDPSSILSSFSYSDLIDGKIKFIHDNSLSPPSYILALKGISTKIEPQPNIADIQFNILPKLKVNMVRVRRGEIVLIKSSMLSASDLDSDQASLMFYISNFVNGQFEKAPTMCVSCTAFSQKDINDQIIYFAHNGGYQPPSFQISLSDGLVTLPSVLGGVSYFIPKGIG